MYMYIQSLLSKLILSWHVKGCQCCMMCYRFKKIWFNVDLQRQKISCVTNTFVTDVLIDIVSCQMSFVFSVQELNKYINYNPTLKPF